MGYGQEELASKIYLWENINPIRNRLEYSWTITTEDGRSMFSTKNCDSVEGRFIESLIDDGYIFFRHLNNYRKDVEIISGVPKEEIIQRRFLPNEIKDFDFKQQGLNSSDLEKALNLFKGR